MGKTESGESASSLSILRVILREIGRIINFEVLSDNQDLPLLDKKIFMLIRGGKVYFCVLGTAIIS